jgi:trans-aconitate methyltransferase
MATRVYPKEGLGYVDAQKRLRGSVHDAIDEHRGRAGAPKRVLDVGCSVGVSTFYAADRYKSAAVDVSHTYCVI